MLKEAGRDVSDLGTLLLPRCRRSVHDVRLSHPTLCESLRGFVAVRFDRRARKSLTSSPRLEHQEPSRGSTALPRGAHGWRYGDPDRGASYLTSGDPTVRQQNYSMRLRSLRFLNSRALRGIKKFNKSRAALTTMEPIHTSTSEPCHGLQKWRWKYQALPTMPPTPTSRRNTLA